MKRPLCLSILFVFIVVLPCCSTKYRYPLISKNELSNLRNIPYGRYIIIPHDINGPLEHEIKKDDDDLVDRTIDLIKRHKLKKLKNYLEKCEINDSDYTEEMKLCWGLYYFYKEDYFKAKELLHQVQEGKYSCWIGLLRADCNYQLQRKSNLVDFESMLSEYQKVHDCSNERYHKMNIRMRIKLMRYQF